MDKNKDLSKKPLGITETYMLASNINRIEDARKMQKMHTELDYILGLLGGLALIPFGVLGAIELFKCAGSVFELIMAALFVVAGFVIDFWYIRLSWKLLTGKI